jgi:N-formylglutamate amidohydrolase
MPQHAFQLFEPAKLCSGVVFASPHSASDYPKTFLQQTILDSHTIRSSEDAFVDQLFDCVPSFGVPFLTAGAPRAFVDLNRATDELDPALVQGVRRQAHNPRIASGLGVVPRVVANSRSIYRGKLPMAEVERRIEDYWRPYHSALAALLTRAKDQFGAALLIDCHSMPHEAVESMAQRGARPPEVVLGDRFGTTASAGIVDRIEAAFASAGLTVSRNAPFAGAYITQTYGKPARNQHAVQIEIDRALYMDEALIQPNENFTQLQSLLSAVVSEISGIFDEQLPLAAE